MASQDNNKKNNPRSGSLAEDAARDAGKSQQEVESTGKVDRTDDATDKLFKGNQSTENSPVYRAFWGSVDPELLAASPAPENPSADAAVKRCIEITSCHRNEGTLFGADGKIAKQVIADLADAGYWGIRIPSEYGGSGISLRSFMRMLVRMASIADASVAGMASVNGCIGVIEPLLQFGSQEQKEKFLPLLASGKKLSAFALTEPGAGSDMTNLKVTATRIDENKVLINGRKLFITNAIPGRLIALVVMLEGLPAVFVVDLPAQEDETFKLEHYGLQALLHVHNNGLVFKDFPVDVSNQLHVPADEDGRENGLIVAYKALNKGRVGLCANASGTSTMILRSLAPDGWAEYRVTYGRQIQSRELVKGGLARIGSLIVAMNAMVDWCSTLLDEGYRGELECIVAKNLGARSLKEVAYDIATTIHGGRSLLKDHVIGENIAEYLAPSIYEGSQPMLSMAFFLSLVKAFGKSYMAPINDAMKRLKKGDLKALPAFASSGARLALTIARLTARRATRSAHLTDWHLLKADATFNRHLDFVHAEFGRLPLKLVGMMLKHQLKLQDKQLVMVRFSNRVQDLVAMAVTAVSGAQSNDPCHLLLADLFCRDIAQKLSGTQPDSAYDRDCVKAADMIIEGQFRPLADVPPRSILQPYN